MSTKTLAYLLLLVCLSIFSASAQENFPGYVVLKTGDTLQGAFTDYQQWNQNPGTVNFHTTGKVAMQLTPENTQFFAVSGYDVYRSFQGQRMLNPTSLSAAQNSTLPKSPVYAPVNSFLRLIGEARNIKIWMLNDKQRKNFYYQLGDTNPVELEFYSYADGNDYQEIAIFRDQLLEIFKLADNKLAFQVRSMLYAESSLQELLRKLDADKNKKVKFKNGMGGLVAFAGLASNAMTYTVIVASREYSFPLANHLAPVIGAGYILSETRNFNRFFAFPQLRYYRFQNKGRVSIYEADVEFESESIIQFNINVGYNLVNKKNLRLFIAPGAHFSFTGGNMQRRIYTNFQSENSEANTAFGGTVQAGALFKNHFMVFGSYQLPITVTRGVFYSARHTSTQLTVGYKF